MTTRKRKLGGNKKMIQHVGLGRYTMNSYKYTPHTPALSKRNFVPVKKMKIKLNHWKLTCKQSQTNHALLEEEAVHTFCSTLQSRVDMRDKKNIIDISYDTTSTNTFKHTHTHRVLFLAVSVCVYVCVTYMCLVCVCVCVWVCAVCRYVTLLHVCVCGWAGVCFPDSTHTQHVCVCVCVYVRDKDTGSHSRTSPTFTTVLVSVVVYVA